MPTFGVNSFIATIFFYLSFIFSIAALRVAYITIQHQIERQIGNYEFDFTQKMARIEHIISGNRLEDVIESDEYYEEDTDIVDPSTVPTINSSSKWAQNETNDLSEIKSSYKKNDKNDNFKEPLNVDENKDDEDYAEFTFQPIID